MDELDYVRGKIVLITGAAGTIGSALAERLVTEARAVRCLDHSENDLFFLDQALRSQGGHASPLVGDIRDMERLRFAMSGVDVVFHTAALKHVGLSEYNPFEVVQTNLQGVNNVIRAALDADVARVIFTSSDKAVNPTNVMGASKMMGERLVAAANEIRGTRRTRFGAVRFGNVIGSRGSVVPIFAQQLSRGMPITLTDEGMTRYVMTIREAASLVIEAGARIIGGEVYVTKMRALRVLDLAHAMAKMLTGKPMKHILTGARRGEKLYEELISTEEQARTLDLGRLLVVLPPDGGAIPGRDWNALFPDAKRVDHEWHSGKDQLMSVADVEQFLREHEVLAPYLTASMGGAP